MHGSLQGGGLAPHVKGGLILYFPQKHFSG